jgi:hypothetical protein
MGRMGMKKNKIKKQDEIIFIQTLNLDLQIFIFLLKFLLFCVNLYLYINF